MPKAILLSYVERDSYIHNLNPLTKLLALFCIVILVFALPGFIYNLIMFLIVVPLAFIAKVNWTVFRTLRFLTILLVIIFVIQGFFYPLAKVPLLVLPFGFTLWEDGLVNAAVICSRLLAMAVYGFLFVLTTHPGDLVSALRKVRSFRIPFSFGYIIISTLQVIPRVQLQIATIIEAQKSRGLETKGNLINRLRSYIPLVGPLFSGGVQQAIERSMALEARAFSAETEKTNYRTTVMGFNDKLIMVLLIAISITVVILTRLF